MEAQPPPLGEIPHDSDGLSPLEERALPQPVLTSQEELCEAFPQLFAAPSGGSCDNPKPPYEIHSIISDGDHEKCVKIVSNEADRHELCFKVSRALENEEDLNLTQRVFMREQTHTNRVRSFFAVRIHDMYEGNRTEPAPQDSSEAVAKGYLGLTMDYFGARSVAGDIRARQKSGCGPYSEAQACFLFIQVAMAVAEAHKNNVMHRDIKPGNVLMRPSGFVCLADFGLASPHKTSTTTCGTPYYMAPEVWLQQQYNNKVDVWSLGVYLYELLCFDRPFRCPEGFEGSKMEGVRYAVLNLEPDFSPEVITVSEKVKELIQWMLTKDPKRRPSIVQLFRHPTVKFINAQFVRAVGVAQAGTSHREEALGTCEKWFKRKSSLRKQQHTNVKQQDTNGDS